MISYNSIFVRESLNGYRILGARMVRFSALDCYNKTFTKHTKRLFVKTLISASFVKMVNFLRRKMWRKYQGNLPTLNGSMSPLFNIAFGNGACIL